MDPWQFDASAPSNTLILEHFAGKDHPQNGHLHLLSSPRCGVAWCFYRIKLLWKGPALSVLHIVSSCCELNWLVVSTPLKNISQLGLFFPIFGKTCWDYSSQYMDKIKHVPNHQPGMLSCIGDIPALTIFASFYATCLCWSKPPTGFVWKITGTLNSMVHDQNCHKWLPIPRNWDTSIFSYWWRKIPRCIPIKSNEQNPCVGLFPTTLPFNKNNQKSRKNELIHPEPLGWLAFWPGIHMSPPTGDSPSSFSPLPSRPRSVSSTLTFLGADLN